MPGRRVRGRPRLFVHGRKGIELGKPMPRSPYSTRPTVEAFWSVDIRELGPGKSLKSGLTGTWRWFRGDQLTYSIDFKIEANDLLLHHGDRNILQRVPLTRTACALGGQRAWFRCRCGRRVAILYADDL